jgi:YVTN family beta-propeller protein
MYVKASDKEVNRIPVEGHPSDITIDPSKDKIYVANGCFIMHLSCTNTVSVISASSDKVISTIPVGKNPSTITSDFSTDKIYVSNSGPDTVSVISASSVVCSTIDIASVPFLL